MKKAFNSFIIIAICGAFAFFSQSCNKLIPAQDVSWSGIDDTVKVPIISDTSIHSALGSGTFTYNLDSMIKGKTSGLVSIKNITSAKLKSCKLTILNPDNDNNFANFKASALYINSSVNPTTILTANVINNPNVYADTLNLPVDPSLDLKNYLYSSSSSGPLTVSYFFGAQLRKNTTKILTVVIHAEYDVKLQPVQ